jgi:hypothetical protein
MEQDRMLDFVKALGHADRLRIIGLLTKSSASVAQVAEALNIPIRDAYNHLSFLEYVGALRAFPGERAQDTVYELDTGHLETNAREHFGGQSGKYEPTPNLDAAVRKVLVAYLNSDGSIRQLPNQPEKLRIILDYLVQAFTPGVIYSEKEVNMILRRFHLDTAGLRRDLIDRGMLQRKSDGSQYWRPGE